MTPETSTPRTDAIAHRGYNESAYIAEMTDLARELERELFACREWSSKLADVADDLRAELADERVLADRLAALIRRYRVGYGGQVVDPECNCYDCKYLSPIDQALAAWKEARE